MLSCQKDKDMSESDIMTNLSLFLNTAAVLIGYAVGDHVVLNRM